MVACVNNCDASTLLVDDSVHVHFHHRNVVCLFMLGTHVAVDPTADIGAATAIRHCSTGTRGFYLVGSFLLQVFGAATHAILSSTPRSAWPTWRRLTMDTGSNFRFVLLKVILAGHLNF